MGNYRIERRGTGIHIHFLSESSAGQVTLMAYLPGYNLVVQTKVQDYKKNAALHKHVCPLR